MDVILLDKINKLGQLGDRVSVKAGYARNFLIPQGKAVIPTEENVAYFKTRREVLEQAANTRLQQAQERSKQLSQLSRVTVSAHAGAEGKLFGSVKVQDIALAVTEAGVKISKQEIRLLNGPLRQLGEHEIAYHLHAEVNGSIIVEVVALASI
ncbi:MAG: 50S ribosomal protein L9 [Candidatus Symbiodolus clandestinus]